MMGLRAMLGVFFLCLLLPVAALAGAREDAPLWLLQAAALRPPTFDKNVSALVLVDDSIVTVSEDGSITTTYKYAVRILTREGRSSAVALEAYTTDREKVREFHAWLIKPSGQVKAYGKNETLDEAQALNDVYDESRIKRISATADAEPGAVFGFQTVSENRPYFHQSIWYFQDTDPVVSSKISVVVSQGWKVSGTTLNHSPVEPAISGTSYTWELRDLPPIESEPASPPLTDLAPRIAIKYFPGEGARNPGVKAFDDWREVSRWYSELADPQAVPDEQIAARARELTATAKTEGDKVRAIARYVQSLQYISIQIGIGRWRPHAASQVFAKSYGDCKDKANLMRAMLKVVNIESYPVLIFSGDADHVRDTWVSPGQFNHCIIAIRVNNETREPTVIEHQSLGRLLIFDATDEHTPVGDLPDEEQGSWALIAAGDAGTLVRMPALPANASRLEREADVVLTPEGSITATLKEVSTGQTAVAERRAFRSLSNSAYREMIEGWVTRGATAAQVVKINPQDNSTAGSFMLDVEFSAGAYAQLMQNRLLVFKPAIVSRGESLFLTDARRKNPVVLEARSFTETVRVKLPSGFDVDELPDPVKLDTSFGSYETKYSVKDGELVFSRALSQRATTIPVDQYQGVRTFYTRIREAEQAPVVLARK